MSTQENVAGYRIYTRYAGDVYDQPIDVGVPSDKDGTMSVVVKHVDDTQDYAFAVTAYMKDGGESTLSNEGFLRSAVVRPVCAEMHCDSSGCAPAVSPDGLSCFSGDPCAVGVCAAGSCQVSADLPMPLDLGVEQFKVTPAGRKRKRLLATAVLPLGDGVAAPFGDASIELRDASTGVLFYRATAPGSDFGLKRRQNAYVYPKKHRRHAPAGANGLKRVALRVGAGGSALTVRASASDLGRLAGDDSLTWVVRLGDRCVRALDMACGPMKRGRMRCR